MKHLEDKLQKACYRWFYFQYPKLRGLLCYNLGNSRNPIDGRRNKEMGLQKGRSDMSLYANGTAYFFEFKTIKGVQSPDQKAWQAKVTDQGFQYHIVRSFADFQQKILSIL
jgi:hypothetical protein